MLRVLVLGERPLVALAAVRALGRAGHHVGVAGGVRATVPGASRWATDLHELPPITTAPDWNARLEATVRRGGYDVVVASADAELARLATDPPGVPSVPALTSAHEALVDKLRLAALAQRAGVAYPRTWPAEWGADAGPPGGAAHDVVVKSARTATWARGRLAVLPGASVPSDEPGRLAAIALIRERGGQPIAQERLTGRKLQAMIVRRAGTTTFRFACAVRRELPPERGAEVMLERLPSRAGPGGEAVAALERLADGAGYDGFVGAELLIDGNDPVVVDVNPRLGGAIGFPELLGLRPIERAVRDAVGLDPLPQPRGPENQRYHHLVRELRRLVVRPGSVRAVLASASPRDAWDVPTLRDPGPDLRRVALRLGRGRRAR